MKKNIAEKDNDIETFYPKNRTEWRAWLQANHNSKQSVWLIYFKKGLGFPAVLYNEAVDEALCFGWIDTKLKPVDEEKFMQYFSKRKAKIVWSKVNKEKILRLISQGLMTKAGEDSIEVAKQNGSWTILDDAEALILPKDLEAEFDKRPNAKQFFLSLNRSGKRNILQWLVLAKKTWYKTEKNNRYCRIFKPTPETKTILVTKKQSGSRVERKFCRAVSAGCKSSLMKKGGNIVT